MQKLLQHNLLPVDEPNKRQVDLKCAAVLLPLVIDQQSNQWHIILTRRAQHLKHHPGQISFPGGRYEADDLDLSTTAKRETFEEIGISTQHIQLIGQLPQQKTTSQYNITPFVGIIDPAYQIEIDQNEVAEAFTVPFEFVTDEKHQKKVTETINDIEYNFYVIEYKQYYIWGATARILVNLTRRLNNES